MQTKIDIYGDKELILHLKKISKEMRPTLNSGLDDVGKHLRNEIKKRFGNYQRGWAKLKRATVLAKQRRKKISGSNGSRFSSLISKINTSFSGDAPLVLSEKLRNSISYEVNKELMNTVVFSDEKYAAVHEYGYAPKNIPARSYMRLTLWEEEDVVKRIISNRIGKIIKISGTGGLNE